MDNPTNNGLTTLTAAAPAFMKQDAKEAAAKIDVTVLNYAHLCQSKSPEVERDEVAKAGDIVIRPTGTNLGKTATCVILDYYKKFMRWGDKRKGDPESTDGKLLWQGYEDELDDQQLSQTRWVDDTPPLANETHTFLAFEVSDQGEIDPRRRGPFAISMDRSATKIAIGLAKQLKSLAQAQGYPPFAVRVKFETEKTESANKEIYYTWKATPVGAVTDEAKYNMLKACSTEAVTARNNAKRTVEPTVKTTARVVDTTKVVEEAPPF